MLAVGPLLGAPQTRGDLKVPSRKAVELTAKAVLPMRQLRYPWAQLPSLLWESPPQGPPRERQVPLLPREGYGAKQPQQPYGQPVLLWRK